MKTLEDYKKYLDSILVGQRTMFLNDVREMFHKSKSYNPIDAEEIENTLKYLEKLELAVHLLETYMIENKE